MKKFFILFFLLFLTNCSATPGTAFLGPIFTGAKSGSIYQASLSYGSNKLVTNMKKEFELRKEKLKKISSSALVETKIEQKKLPTLNGINIDPIIISEVIDPEPLP
tara:strand:+ start:890 stop:1207 length:318 start_codon:yes stop_codon:yes gene_type:complete